MGVVVEKVGLKINILSSPLTLQLLVINSIALIILCVGVLYSAQYERELVRNELKSLETQAEMLADALSQQAVRVQDAGASPVMADDLARPIIRRMIGQSGAPLRVVLFNKSGKLLVDSHRMQGYGEGEGAGRDAIEIEEIAPPYQALSFIDKLDYLMRAFLKKLPFRYPLPLYPETLSGEITTYPHALETISGSLQTSAWSNEQGEMILMASVPVQKILNVHGALVLFKKGNQIDDAIYVMQKRVLTVFLWMLMLTFILSLYLYERIAKPIQTMAYAVRLGRFGKIVGDQVPDYSKRKDEIGTLSVQLRAMMDVLSQRLGAIEHFAADVRHELKNPLTSLKSSIDLMMLAKISDAEREKIIQTMSYDVKRMNNLVNVIASSSLLETELHKETRDYVRIIDLLTHIIAYQKDKFEKADIQMTFDYTVETLSVEVYALVARLEQVFLNILDNAYSFVSPKGYIAVKATADLSHVVITIDNNGPKLDEENRERIFERFYTLRNRQQQGDDISHSGLGLSICREIIHSYGGAIKAFNLYNEQGEYQAVRFEVTLPRADLSL